MPTHPRLRLREDDAPPLLLGLAVAAGAVALTTLLIYALDDVAPVVSLGVVYLVAVLLVSSVWGWALGVGTALASALAFNFFHIPPTGRFTIREGENWVALVVFLIAAVLASTLAGQARARAREADQRRQEADLAAEMARLLLRGGRLEEALPLVAHRLAQGLGLPSVALELRSVEGDDRRVAFPLREHTRQIGTLLVPAALSEAVLHRLQRRVVPQLEALLAAALERDELLGDAVETAALRRSDVLKTALLRAVSHDLRSPLTAILAAVDALGSPGITEAERASSSPTSAPRPRGSRASSTTCSTCRGWRRTRPSRGARGVGGRGARAAADDLGLPRGHASSSRSTPTCRSPRPTPRSSSARSRTCSRTPRATPAATRSRCGPAPSAGA